MAARQFLRSVPLFARMSEEQLARVAKVCVERTIDKGSTIFFENDPGDALYLIADGHIRIYRVAEDGREKTLTLLSGGEYFGEMSLFDMQPRSAIAEAVEKSRVFVMHRDEFDRLLDAEPSIARAVIQGLCFRLRAVNEQLMDAVFLDVRGRLVSRLLDLAQRQGVDHPSGRMIDMKLTHQELAHLVGTARESVSRILAEFQDLDLIAYDRRRIVLTDLARLRAEAGGAGR